MFNIDHWITYAQNYVRSVGLNLDPTATACWDNPITVGAHCTYLEGDLQSRLNRYAKDGTILDVWVWVEPRTDGSYDLYIGYARSSTFYQEDAPIKGVSIRKHGIRGEQQVGICRLLVTLCCIDPALPYPTDLLCIPK